MDNNIIQKLSQKIAGANSVLVFMFNPDGTVQGFAEGNMHELMATIATEMKKSHFIKTTIEGAINLYKSQQQ